MRCPGHSGSNGGDHGGLVTDLVPALDAARCGPARCPAAAEAVGRYHAFLHRVTAARTRLLDLIFRAHDTGADDWARRARVLEVVAEQKGRRR